MRRSMLFLPGNTPNIIQNGGILGADAVILDLEDEFRTYSCCIAHAYSESFFHIASFCGLRYSFLILHI